MLIGTLLPLEVVQSLGEVGWATVLALLLAAFLAGWVDAVVGGGGLIQLPALLIGLPADTPPAVILGTNKISSVWGTATSSVVYARKLKPDWRSVLPLVLGAAGGSALGAQAARFLPREAFTPIVLAALVVVGVYTWRRPELGLITSLKRVGPAHYWLTFASGLAVGIYDGILGPGTGSFFVILLVGVLGWGFLDASAQAKIANLVTNLAAITVFAMHDAIWWKIGLAMGAANLVGGLIGARTAITRGNTFVRKVFLIVVGALILRLAYDVISGFF